MARHAGITLTFKIGDFGWSETFYYTYGDLLTIAALVPLSSDLQVARMKLCGSGVKAGVVRISDVQERRDADDVYYPRFTAPDGVDALSYFDKDYINAAQLIKPAATSQALIPNVCAVIRVEADDKRYHSEHFMSGIPASIVGRDSSIVPLKGWTDQLDDFQTFLKRPLAPALFPVLLRTDVNADRAVIDYSEGGDVPRQISLITLGLTVGDRVRLINWHKPTRSGQRTCVARIETIGAGYIILEGNQPPAGWTIGPKSIVHREETGFVPITSFSAEKISHRNRGRPSDSPRGRRSRRG